MTDPAAPGPSTPDTERPACHEGGEPAAYVSVDYASRETANKPVLFITP